LSATLSLTRLRAIAKSNIQFIKTVRGRCIQGGRRQDAREGDLGQRERAAQKKFTTD
jgi:hypothetical protein